MDFEKLVLLEFYIQIETLAESDVVQTNKHQNRLHPHMVLAESDGAPGKKRQKGLHPNMALSQIRWRTSNRSG